jgi:hypothetical protein
MSTGKRIVRRVLRAIRAGIVLARTNSNLRFWPTLTRPEPVWTGRVGRVRQHLFEAISRRDMKDNGFDRKQIIAEKYD